MNKTGRMKSGNEGWIRVAILDYSDIVAKVPGGILTRGGVETYTVRFEEGKHKGEIRTVPGNYVELSKGTEKPKPGYEMPTSFQDCNKFSSDQLQRRCRIIGISDKGSHQELCERLLKATGSSA